MAETVVSYAIQKIGDAIINEALFQGSVRQQAEELKQELKWMWSFLPEAHTKARGGNQLVQNWVRRLEEAAHDAEDLIESIAIQGSEPGRRRGFFSKLMPSDLIRRNNFGLEIEELRQRIINIRVGAAGYGIEALPDDRLERRVIDQAIAWWRAVALHAPDSSHAVRMEDEKASILHLLDPEREKRRSVVSIVGMGGIGKTILANKVFNDSRIKERFDCAFWIDVTQDYNDVKLLKHLLCEIYPEESKKYESMKKTSLERCLHESLQGKTYLIVMDDVCDREVWRIFGEHLPDEGNGSKVLITTRKREVADAADPDQATRAYELRFLNRKESWELFLSKAIPREEDRSECTGKLKELGEEMADKCGGVPLALVVMGALLSQKQRSIAEWEKVSGSNNFGLEIEQLMQRIINIGEGAAAYGIEALPDGRQERRVIDQAIARWRAVALHAPDSSHAVLMEGDKEAILHLLDPKREKRRSVTSIVGMGGLGKTTLANKVFNDSRIKERFDCAFWIDVTQDYNDVKLLKHLLCEIYPEESKKYESMKKTSLERCLHESLQGKTYLIVMDDVCDREVWRIFGEHLPDEGNGSKVLITTRKREVADAADPDQATRAYELRFLNRKESWELFLSKAIPREEDRSECTGKLKELGEKMADKCGGLPLALVVMGGLLSQKQLSITEWEKVSRSMVWQYEDEGLNCMIILALSYTDLPYDLKWCFLYLSAFPEDYQIESDRLIRLWIAEGFIAERGDGLTLEEMAEIQLERLIQRSLVHVVSLNPEYGVISCRVHDLLRELCISEAKEIDFMSVCQGRSHLPAESLRRLSILTEPEETISRLKSAPRLRALLGFNFKFGFGSEIFMNLSLGGLKLIRVIDLEGARNLYLLPKDIGRLVNLRYLSLRGTSIELLPKKIKNLSRLQFLDVRETLIKQMTSAVWEIETLRQLFFPYAAWVRNRVQCRWRSLQVLRGASAGNWLDDTLHKVKDLQALELHGISVSSHAVLSLNLPQFSRLRILILQGSSIPWTALTLSGLHLLCTLVLNGPIKSTFPEEVRSEDIPGSLRGLSCLELNYGWPAGLTYLELVDSDLHRDPLPSLGQLSELRILTLKRKVYSWGEGMKFSGDEFKQLQKLYLVDLNQLERMTVEDGAMPRLQKLQISDCPRLKTIPPRLEDLAECASYMDVDIE